MIRELQFLQDQGVNPFLIQGVEEFRRQYAVADEVKSRIVAPSIPF